AWTLTATGNPATNPATLSGPGAAGNADVVSGSTFDAGTYDLSELGGAGTGNYTASNWSCTGGQTGTAATVTVALGDDITCTITNDDNAPKLTLNKVVVNDNGGTKAEPAWTLTAPATRIRTRQPLAALVLRATPMSSAARPSMPAPMTCLSSVAPEPATTRRATGAAQVARPAPQRR